MIIKTNNLNSNSNVKIIRSFDLDLSHLPAASTRRNFTIQGTNGSKFKLEITNEDSPKKYYNFKTKTFTTTVASLEEQINGNYYTGSIIFPTVTDDDHYDIKLWALDGTLHDSYKEVRFGDGSIDINSSTGSNSFLLQKIIYQYTDLTLTISPFSPNATIAGTLGNDNITLTAGDTKTSTDFSITVTAAADKAYRIIRQPTADDIVSFVSSTVGAVSTLQVLPGEIYGVELLEILILQTLQ